MKKTLFLLGLLLLFLATTVIAVDDICVKQVKEERIMQNGLADDIIVPIPDIRFKFPAYGNYDLIIKGYKKVDGGWGKRLNIIVIYCDKQTKEVALELELYPGSGKNPGVGYPKITYEGPIGADLNVRCLAVGEKDTYSAANNLFFSQAKNFETLLFKKAVARHVRAVSQSISRGSQPMITNSVRNNPPHPLDDPVDLDAQNSCFGVVDVNTG